MRCCPEPCREARAAVAEWAVMTVRAGLRVREAEGPAPQGLRACARRRVSPASASSGTGAESPEGRMSFRQLAEQLLHRLFGTGRVAQHDGIRILVMRLA